MAFKAKMNALVLDTGDVCVNTQSGSSGQVLTSSGTGTPPTWVAPTNKSMLLFGATSATGPIPTTEYLWPGLAGASVTTEIDMIIPMSGTVSKMYIKATAGPTVGTLVFTVRKNGSNQSLTATLSTGGTTASDTSNSFSVTAGDAISVRVVSNGTLSAASTNVRVSLLFTAS